MALTTTRSLITYTGNGTQKAFTFPYSYLRAAHIRVTIIKVNGDEVQLTPGTDFSVSPDGGTAGTVTLATAPAAGEKVRIQRVVPLIQPESFPIQGPFDPRAVESLFDWQMMAIQQLSDGVGVHVHGIEPGGNLHALASEQDHGFLSKHDYAWMKQHQGAGAAHEIDQIRNLPDRLTELQLDIFNRAPVVHNHPISAITGLRAELDAIELALEGKEDIGSTIPWYRISEHPVTLDGYGITDGASIQFVDGKIAAVNVELANKADKATTYTKYEVDAALLLKADTANVYTKSQVDSALTTKANITDVYTKFQVDSALAAKANIADVYTKTEVDTSLNAKADKLTTYTKSEVDAAISTKADKSTTYTKSEVDAALLAKADVTSVYTKSETNNLLGNKADKATSLAGYGILDAYTKSETNSLLVAKADKANTLSGYGITDAYTKAEVNSIIDGLPIPRLYAARFTSNDGQTYFLEAGDSSFYFPEAEAQNGVILVQFAAQGKPVMFTFSFGPPSESGSIVGHLGGVSSNEVEIVFTAGELDIFPTYFDIWAFVVQL